MLVVLAQLVIREQMDQILFSVQLHQLEAAVVATQLGRQLLDKQAAQAVEVIPLVQEQPIKDMLAAQRLTAMVALAAAEQALLAPINRKRIMGALAVTAYQIQLQVQPLLMAAVAVVLAIIKVAILGVQAEQVAAVAVVKLIRKPLALLEQQTLAVAAVAALIIVAQHILGGQAALGS